MTAFVILHYNSIDDTIKCVDSILYCLKEENIKIIIVDNNSPNQSGLELQKKYYSNSKIDVILNKNNEGFARGNNIGCSHAIKKHNPDFLCVFNNDTFINDVDFIKKINSSYATEPFDALGPKIWNIQRNYNQNPFSVITNLAQTNQTIEFYKKASKYLYSIFPYSYYFYCKYNSKKFTYGKGLNGAALIFSKRYYQKFSSVIPELTFMYGEENFLHYRKEKYNLNFCFDFDITVYHNHSSSTRHLGKTVVKKWKFQYQYIMEALKRLKEIYFHNYDI